MLARFISAIISVVALLIGIFATSADILPYGLSVYSRQDVAMNTTLSVSGGCVSDASIGGGIHPKADSLIKVAALEIEGKNHAPIYSYAELGEMPYDHGIGIKRLNCHAGQAKLLLTEIEFLTCCAVNTNFIIYAGSAPCEKLPVLLQMFPDKKWLLVDPNYHSFHAPDAHPTIVYQNVDRIGSETLANTRKDMKIANRTNINAEDRKRLINISLQDKPVMYKSKYRGDMSRVDNPEHATAMREIQREFESKNYRELATDIIRGDSRVYIVQDYMSESLCKLIYESIQIANTELKIATHTCFISDLRTNFFGSSPVDLDFIWNDSLQLIFLKLLQPNFSMLKFHPPYFDYKTSLPLIAEMEAGSTTHAIYPIIAADLKTCREQHGLDFLAVYKERKNKHKYLKSSNIWLQAWGPSATSEARLIISKADIAAPYQTYCGDEWDRRFQFNKLTRSYSYYGALYESIKDTPGHTYDGCFDCMLEMLVLLNYAFRDRAPSSPTTMNISALVNLLKEPSVKTTLVALQKQINDVVIYARTQKCFYHGQLTRPLKEPIFYEHVFEGRENWINQARVTNGNVTRTRAIQYDCAHKPASFKILPGIKLRLGSNVAEISKYNAEKFAQSGLAYCKGEH